MEETKSKDLRNITAESVRIINNCIKIPYINRYSSAMENNVSSAVEAEQDQTPTFQNAYSPRPSQF